MSNTVTISDVRQALRALRNTLETKGQADKKYNLMMGVSFAPAKGLNADQVIASIEGNRKVSANLIYGIQAGLRVEPKLELGHEAAVAELDAFEKTLADLPQELGTNMMLEFTVSNPHEKEIVLEAQKAINAIKQATPEDVQKLKTA